MKDERRKKLKMKEAQDESQKMKEAQEVQAVGSEVPQDRREKMIKSFEDIQVWQKAMNASLLIYTGFQNCKDFKFKDQIQSAAISVMNNIAEGFERKGSKEFERFLYIAKGSSGEVRSMLYMAQELKYVSKSDFAKFIDLYEEISKMLAGFIRSLHA